MQANSATGAENKRLGKAKEKTEKKSKNKDKNEEEKKVKVEEDDSEALLEETGNNKLLYCYIFILVMSSRL